MKLGLGPRFDARDQEAEHVVEDLDLVVAEAFSVVEKEIGDLSEGFHPSGGRTASYGVLEFGDDRMSRLLHGGSLLLWLLQGFGPDNGGSTVTSGLRRKPPPGAAGFAKDNKMPSRDRHRATCRR